MSHQPTPRLRVLPELERLWVRTHPFRSRRLYAGRRTFAFGPHGNNLSSASLSRGSSGLSVRCRSRLAQVGGRLLQHLMGHLRRIKRIRTDGSKFLLKLGLNPFPGCMGLVLHMITSVATAASATLALHCTVQFKLDELDITRTLNFGTRTGVSSPLFGSGGSFIVMNFIDGLRDRCRLIGKILRGDSLLG